MSKTITRLFDSRIEAFAVVEDLETAGIDRQKISLVSNNTDRWYDAPGGEPGQLGDRNRDGENEVAEGAGKGAATGGLLGAGAGLLAGLGMLAIPGLGPVVAAGWLASTAVGAVVGATAGGAAGGLLGALKEAGHSDDEANVYAEGVRRGGTLVSVKAHDDEIGTVQDVLDRRQGVDAAVRGEFYRRSGWSGFDQSAEPYNADQIAREHDAYIAESRSFAANGDVDDLARQEELRRSDTRPLGAPDTPRGF